MKPTQESMHRLGSSYRRLGRLVLRIIDGPDTGREFVLEAEQGRTFTGGRSDVHDVTLRDEKVSKTHFELRLAKGGEIVLRDLESTNGIMASGLRIREAEVAPGAQFLVGHSLLELSAADQVDVQISKSNHFGDMYGECAAMREVFQILKGIAGTDLAKRILIAGETGTGKELVARGIHEHSPRRDRPYVVFDCTGVPRDLVQAKLFGHTRDAYTGARKDRLGCFRTAHGGTLFIDEIGELPLEVQPMLLRALETGEIIPLGEERVHRVNVRVVAATHRDLRAMVAKERFRQDLFYRLRGVTVELPPLREREDDVLLLARRFLRHVSSEYNLSPFRLTPGIVEVLRAELWPGNVRQLRHSIESAALQATMRGRSELLPEDIEREAQQSAEVTGMKRLYRLQLKAAELEFKKLYYRDLLSRFRKLKDAASAAGISEETLRKDRKRLGLGRDGALVTPRP